MCGSLSQRYTVGDVVLYQDCVYQTKVQACDRTFTAEISSRVQEKASLVKSLTSDRIISSSAEKRHLGETSGADVVDMEGFAALEFFNASGVKVAMLSVMIVTTISLT